MAVVLNAKFFSEEELEKRTNFDEVEKLDTKNFWEDAVPFSFRKLLDATEPEAEV